MIEVIRKATVLSTEYYIIDGGIMEQTTVSYLKKIKKITNQLQTNFVIIDENFQMIDSNMEDLQQYLQQKTYFFEHFYFQHEDQLQFQHYIVNEITDVVKAQYKKQDGTTFFAHLYSQPMFLEKQYYIIILKAIKPNAASIFTDVTDNMLIEEDSYKIGIQNICSKIDGSYIERYANAPEREKLILRHLIIAIHNKEITAHFQAKYAIYNEKIISMEALARWISPELGFISPVEFITIAENAGLIYDIDLQMIERVLEWQQQCQYEGKRIVPIAVNISPKHFYHPQFIPDLTRLIEQYYVDPKYLIIEVTENIGLVDFEQAGSIINKLRALGIVVSVDDFGVGYSSLSYLQKFAFNELKIDRSFIVKIDELATKTIVKAVIEIAHTLEMDVIAEGVETQEQFDILKSIRCDGIQGYYFAKPIPIDEATKLIQDEREKGKRYCHL